MLAMNILILGLGHIGKALASDTGTAGVEGHVVFEQHERMSPESCISIRSQVAGAVSCSGSGFCEGHHMMTSD